MNLIFKTSSFSKNKPNGLINYRLCHYDRIDYIQENIECMGIFSIQNWLGYYDSYYELYNSNILLT